MARTNSLTKKPWEDYKERVEHPQLTYEQVVEEVINLSRKDLKLGALLSTLILTCSRIHEILPYRYYGLYRDKIEIFKPGWQLKLLTITQDGDGNEYWMIKSRVEKLGTKLSDGKISIENREKSLSKDKYKEMFQYAEEDAGADYKLIRILHEFFKAADLYKEDLNIAMMRLASNVYVNPFKEHLLELQPFLGYSYKTVYNIVKKRFKSTPHALRVMRATYLDRNHRLSAKELMTLVGWKTANMVFKYVQTDRKIIMKKMKLKEKI